MFPQHHIPFDKFHKLSGQNGRKGALVVFQSGQHLIDTRDFIFILVVIIRLEHKGNFRPFIADII